MKSKFSAFFIVTFIAAVALSFGCGGGGGGKADSGEIPDVQGDYAVKASTCAFAAVNQNFSVTQNQTDKELLAISLNNKAFQIGKVLHAFKEMGETSVINASVSSGGL